MCVAYGVAMRSALFFACVMSSLLAACGGGAPAEVICDSYCDLAARCGGARTDCGEQCVDENPVFEKFSESLANAIETCVAESSCTFDPKILTACVEPKVEPTERTRAYCEVQVRSSFECGYVDFAADCEASYAQFSDAVLDELESCHVFPLCEERDQCLQTIFDSLL